MTPITCGTCGRDALPDGDCYGCEVDRLQKKLRKIQSMLEARAQQERLTGMRQEGNVARILSEERYLTILQILDDIRWMP